MNSQEQNNDLEAMNKLLKERLEECGGDYVKYLMKYNRHTLKVTLTDEQSGREVVGSEITFCNQDNALSHLSCVCEFFDLLTEEGNQDWGYSQTSDELVNRILTPMRQRLQPKK